MWNDFINNSQAAELYILTGLTNTFAYNYWDDWTGPDMNNDGIVDEPYIIIRHYDDSHYDEFHKSHYDEFPLTAPNSISPPNSTSSSSSTISVSTSSGTTSATSLNGVFIILTLTAVVGLTLTVVIGIRRTRKRIPDEM